mgnify:CR=1 FL=1
MRFDVVLIGGGLSSLVCGIKLQKAGRKCLMVSACLLYTSPSPRD